MDSSVLFAGAYSQHSAARDLLNLAYKGQVHLVVSELVLNETRRNLQAYDPTRSAHLKLLEVIMPWTVVDKPSSNQVLRLSGWTALKDAPIVAAALNAKVQYLVTYDRKHLLGNALLERETGLLIVTPDIIVAKLETPLL